MKKCNVCKQEKTLDDFSKDKSRKDGYANKCKQCRKIENQLNYKKLETRTGTRTHTQEKFFNKIDKNLINKYVYDKTIYEGINKKLKLKCITHGEFEILPQQFQKGNGCSICQNVRKYTTQEFIDKATHTHGNKFDYSLVDYQHSNEKITIICPIHGEFKVKPSNHLSGNDCFKCKNNKQYLTNEEFIHRAKLIHGDKYDYSLTNYSGIINKVKIICPIHGEFETFPQIHMNGSNCQQCAVETLSYSSQYEQEIINFIKEKINDINIIQCYRLENKEIDIYLPEYNLGIEFNGLYWHSHLHKETNYHKNKSDFFYNNGIQIFYIWEDQWLNKREIIKSMILNKLKLNQTKIYARKCEIKEINSKLYREFCNNNHIQGYGSSKLKLGLFYNNELVSCMSFGGLRVNLGNKNRRENHWELVRFCNKINFTIIGAASRLLKWFEKNVFPVYLVSYADRDYSQGNLYFQLNFNGGYFTNIAYKYYNPKTGEMSNRFNYRKSELVKMGYDSNLTESQIINQIGLYRLNNSGILKFEKFY